MTWARRIDRFTLAIAIAALIGLTWPAAGEVARGLDWLVRVVIAALFFLYGIRLSPAQARAGLAHWRLHLLILGFTFAVFPLVGLAFRLLPEGLIPLGLQAGVLYLCLVPSTVQSSINFTSVARGNVAGAIVSASLSNLVGVVATPLLCVALMQGSGLVIDPSTALDIGIQLLLPFALGQASRRWTAQTVAAHPRLRMLDQAAIVLVVYSAFSASSRDGLWAQVTWTDLAILLVACLAILAFMLWLTWVAAIRLGLSREDAITVQFCGTKKSLATGVPMAALIFAGQPVGLIVLPLMVFHQAQLMVCGWLAGRHARGSGH